MSELPPTPAAPPPERKPMSMAWVAAAIGCFVVVHTLINLAYRKPGRPHEPAAEARERQSSFVQGDMKGWTRFAATLTARTTAVSPPVSAPVTRTPAPEQLFTLVPFELVGRLNRDPRLYPAPTSLTAPAALPADGALPITLEFTGPGFDPSAPLGEVLAYAKEHQLHVFLQDDSRVVPGASPTPAAPRLELSLPPDVLPAGDWQATLYTKDEVFTWTFQVQPAGP